MARLSHQRGKRGSKFSVEKETSLKNSRISSSGSEITPEKKILEAEAALNANGEGS